ncbi:hypothetical protein [uncultured Dysgonomonas sp.]|uniref:Uncharacterized protein n=1 Tax=uncultured Dysgonomonas sp. TaxID=206096 RepID=A0A212K669_9BACT|nr:hypothetical protein [uncultured Dysgonomonas sp.]SBW07166.1 conserved hypothetical protein [uncultured Dysgonomonas sp.]
MKKTKELVIKVNGTENVDKLRDSLDKVDIKIKGLAISAEDIAALARNNIEEILEQAILHAAKIGATITELSAHTEQAIDKNKEAAQQLVQSIRKSDESILSSIKATVKELPVIMESYLTMITNSSEMQTTLLADQTNKNKELIEKSLTDIEVKYIEKGKRIKDANLKTYENFIGDLKGYKSEIESAILQTGIQYDAMSAHYDKDSEEFKKAQEEKKAALDSLQKKVVEINVKIEESNISFLDKWNKMSDDAINQAAEKSKKIGDSVKDMTKLTEWNDDSKFKVMYDGINNLTKPLDNINTKQEALYKQETEYIDKSTTRKKAELDKQIKELEQEAKDKKKELEVDRLTAEKGINDSNVGRYKGKISELEKDYGLEKDTESGEYKEVAGWDEMSPEQQKEIDDAKDRLEQLNALQEQEAKASADKAKEIKEANDIIFQSEQKVLDEKQRIEAEKAALDRKATEEKAKAEEKLAKKKEQMAKIQRIKDKAEHVVKIAQAISDVAGGVTKTLGAYPWPLNVALAALVGLQGGIQVKIMTEQLKYMENGGLLNGKRHTQGGMRIEGTNIEVEGGEYVINRESTSKNLGLVRYINSQRKELTAMDTAAFFAQAKQRNFELPFQREFAAGGMMPAPFLAPNFSSDNDALVHAIKNIRIESGSSGDNEALINAIKGIRIEPRVAVTDIIRAQEDAVQVDMWSGN